MSGNNYQNNGSYGYFNQNTRYRADENLDPFANYQDNELSRSTDRLQELEPSHQRESNHQRSNSQNDYTTTYANDNGYSGAYRGAYHDDPQMPLPYINTSQPVYAEQFSPINNTSNNNRVPDIAVDYADPHNAEAHYDDEYYNNETLGASFNAFPTDQQSIPDLPPLPPNQSGQTRYYGNQNYNRLDGPFTDNIELQDGRYMDPEANIGMGPISGDNYELNTFPQEVYEGGGVNTYADENGDEYEVPEESQRRRVEVGLLNGNLILDCPVSDRLKERYTGKNLDDSREFQYMRYQAVTCDPKFFAAENFSLRQRYYKRPREIELFIVVTLYNEDEILLARTLKGVFENIKHLEGRNRSQVWGKDSWKKIVVCIVADGRSKINETSQALLAALGVYQEGFARNAVNDKKVVSHIYEYSSMIGISSVERENVKLTTGDVPVQLLFCLKEENKKKINSHRWALEAFATVLNPKVVVLLDAGTQPGRDSIYHLWKEFDKDPRVAGTCGEIKAMLGSRYEKLLNPLVAAQNFEYKMSNILDKPMESSFGFISVLPGAFSAYRYTALLNDFNGEGPLEKYFEGEVLHADPSAGIFKSNMYLAEDRILCFELVAKKNCSWILRYCRSASAETDVPEEVHDFVSQRRRWLNGSFFAAIYSIVHFTKIWGTAHSAGRKFALLVEFVYQFISLLVSWFSLGSYFLVFRILTTSLGDLYTPCKYLSVIFLWLYLLSVVTTFILSFGNTPKGTPRFYVVIICFFAVLMAYMMAAAIILSVDAIKDVIKAGDFSANTLITNSTFRDLIISTASTYALYFIGSFISLKPMHMFTSFLQYLLLSPSYVNVLNIYAFCNLHDISWGTKGSTAQTLGDAKVSEDGKVEFVDAPITSDEINELYEKQMDILAHVPKEKPVVTEHTMAIQEMKKKEKQEEDNKNYYAFVRSMVVLTWITTNFIIIALVLETAGINTLDNSDSSQSSAIIDSRSEVFLTVILWIVAFMALFRLVGTVYYLINRMVK